jgi:hypothetical protein
MKRLALLALLSVPISSCSLREYTTDISSQPRSLTAVGRCFSLRRDAFVLEAPRRVTVEKPRRGELEVYGVISVWDGAESHPKQVLRLPAGTRLIVERVLSRHSPMVGDVLTTYLRFGDRFEGRYLDASELFEFTFPEDPVLPVKAYLESCG